MKRAMAIVGGLAIGVAAMLGILQPWKRGPRPGTPAAPVASPDPHDEARRLVRLAEADLGAREFITAQKRLAEAASLAPELFEVALIQGQLEMALDDWSAARRSYTDALKRRPGDAQALLGRATARFELKEFAGAIEDATAAVEKEPDALFTRAAAYGALDRQEDSIRDWTAYLVYRPKDAHAWMNRGNANRRMGRASAAVSDWLQASKLDPSLRGQLEPLISEAAK